MQTVILIVPQVTVNIVKSLSAIPQDLVGGVIFGMLVVYGSGFTVIWSFYLNPSSATDDKNKIFEKFFWRFWFNNGV